MQLKRKWLSKLTTPDRGRSLSTKGEKGANDSSRMPSVLSYKAPTQPEREGEKKGKGETNQERKDDSSGLRR